MKSSLPSNEMNESVGSKWVVRCVASNLSGLWRSAATRNSSVEHPTAIARGAGSRTKETIPGEVEVAVATATNYKQLAPA